MPIEFFCPTCQSKLRTPDETAGKMMRCPKCGQIGRIPNDQYVTTTPTAAAAPPVSPYSRGVSRNLAEPERERVPDQFVHQDAEILGAKSKSDNPYSAPVMNQGLPSFRYQPTETFMSARLNVPGFMMLLLAVLGLVFCALVFVSYARRVMQAGINDDDIPALIILFLGALMSLISLVGALAMIRRRCFGLALAGSISTIIGGFFCCFFPALIGVWSLIVLLMADTRSAFR